MRKNWYHTSQVKKNRNMYNSREEKTKTAAGYDDGVYFLTIV